MKLRYKLGLGFLTLFTVLLVTLAVTIGYTKDCGPTPAVAFEGESVKAITYRCYGGPEVLEFTDIAKPVPADNEVLVKVEAAGVNPMDWHYMRGSPYLMRLMSGIGAPTSHFMGADFAGTVIEVGAAVTRYQPGDAVFGGRNGAFGQYLTIRETSGLTLKPDNVSFEEAAGVPIAAVTALQALRDKGELRAGQKVLVNGASGGVGTYAVQIAKAMGAEVHGVCSTRNVEMVRSIGADHVFDYKSEDYLQTDQRYDLVLDTVGNHSPLENSRIMTPDGILVSVGGATGNWIGPLLTPVEAMVTDPFVSQSFRGLLAILEPKDMEILAGMMAAGEVRTVIDRRYPLQQVPEAIAYSETGRARGKIIINIP